MKKVFFGFIMLTVFYCDYAYAYYFTYEGLLEGSKKYYLSEVNADACNIECTLCFREFMTYVVGVADSFDNIEFSIPTDTKVGNMIYQVALRVPLYDIPENRKKPAYRLVVKILKELYPISEDQSPTTKEKM